MYMYLQTVISKKKFFLLDVLKVTDEIAGSGSISQRYPDPYKNFLDPQHWQQLLKMPVGLRYLAPDSETEFLRELRREVGRVVSRLGNPEDIWFPP